MRNNAVIKAVYTGNGVTRRWSIPFDYFDTAEIHVLLTVIVADLEQETEVDSDSFTIDTDSNEVVYPKSASDEPVPTGTKITIYRSTDTLQQADYTNQGAMWPETLESSLDKIHQVLQEHSEGMARSFTVSMSSNKTPKEYADELIAGSIAAVEAAAGAANSEAAAANSATAAAGNAAAALASQQAAATSATNAAASATAAAQSATDLAAAVQQAEASASAAAGSAMAAATSETNAAASAGAAFASQQAAAGLASAAATSETNAAASATNASNSASAAAGSATKAAETAASIDHHAGYRQPSTAYADGAMATHHALPYGWYLECTAPGITDSGDITLPSPITENATVTDGTVVWTIRKMGAADLSSCANTDLSNLSATGEAKIQSVSPRYLTDSYYDTTGDWYRVYSDGWVEQGGIYTNATATSNIVVNLLKPMADDKYSVTVARKGNAAYSAGTDMINQGTINALSPSYNRPSTTSFYLNNFMPYSHAYGCGDAVWKVEGKGATS